MLLILAEHVKVDFSTFFPCPKLGTEMIGQQHGLVGFKSVLPRFLTKQHDRNGHDGPPKFSVDTEVSTLATSNWP